MCEGLSESTRIALGIINIDPRAFKRAHIRKSLILFFFIGGMGDFLNKLFVVVVGAIYKDFFLVAVFGVALLVSLIETLKNRKISKLDVIFGVAVGLPNMLTAYFFIAALGILNATIVFPVYSGGAILISIVYSRFAFGEKILMKEKIGIGLILIALICVNL